MFHSFLALLSALLSEILCLIHIAQCWEEVEVTDYSHALV